MPGHRSFEEDAHRRAFGERVKILRAERQWTQEDLAEAAGLHRSYLASIESGSRNPSLDIIVRIANGLEVAISHLFIGDEAS